MIKIDLYDLKNRKEFSKYFDDVMDARKFMLRCKYGHSLYILGYSCDDPEENEFLSNVDMR